MSQIFAFLTLYGVLRTTSFELTTLRGQVCKTLQNLQQTNKWFEIWLMGHKEPSILGNTIASIPSELTFLVIF